LFAIATAREQTRFYFIGLIDFFTLACYYTSAMKYLEAKPERCSGELTIKGTRIRVAQVINMLANGSTIEQLHDGWPWLSVATLKGAVEEATQLLSDQVHA
jgi:uncharacterized protein (DUF433 family)